jgi:two-component system cell cycle response regulator
MSRRSKAKMMFLQEMTKQMQFLDMLFLGDGSQSDIHAQCVKAYRFFHSWKGSAPVFGLDEIGQLASHLELIWRWVGEPHTLSLDQSERALKFQSSIQATLPYYRQVDQERALRMKEIERSAGEESVQQPTRQQRILVVDDDPVLRSYLAQNLKLDGYQVDEAGNVESAKIKLRQNTYHLITLDLIMEPTMGYELFEFLKQDISLKWIPLIVLSGRNDLPDKIRCFNLGADDYVTKPFEVDELVARISRILTRMSAFEQMAFRDPLTGIYNRRYVDNQIEQELRRVERNPAPLSLCFLDIDRFKSINDTYGHQIGDLVLQGLAHKLQHTLRISDLLGRYGGEEFTVIFPGLKAEQAKTIMDNFLDSIRGVPIAHNEGEGYSITFSAGIAEFNGTESSLEWIGRADSVMYQAKQEGRDRVYIADNKKQESAVEEANRKRVLIVEDEEILRSILVSIMVSAGFDTTESIDGVMAYELLKKEQFDIAMIDIVMPNMDGLTLLSKIRNEQLPGGKPMKTILFSSNKNDQDMHKASALGADAFLTKPFSLIELEQKVKQLLSKE